MVAQNLSIRLFPSCHQSGHISHHSLHTLSRPVSSPQYTLNCCLQQQQTRRTKTGILSEQKRQREKINKSSPTVLQMLSIEATAHAHCPLSSAMPSVIPFYFCLKVNATLILASSSTRTAQRCTAVYSQESSRPIGRGDRKRWFGTFFLLFFFFPALSLWASDSSTQARVCCSSSSDLSRARCIDEEPATPCVKCYVNTIFTRKELPTTHMLTHAILGILCTCINVPVSGPVQCGGW